MNKESERIKNQYEINLNDTVFNITSKFPEIVDIMKEAGFKNISEKGMIQTAGRFMSISKGAKLMNIPIENITEALKNRGYKVKY